MISRWSLLLVGLVVLSAGCLGVGSAGGHHDMAGGEIPLGIFADYTSDDTQLLDIVEQVITSRLVAELNLTDESKE